MLRTVASAGPAFSALRAVSLGGLRDTGSQFSRQFSSANKDGSLPYDLNFAPASSKDSTVYGSSRPGGVAGDGPIPAEVVNAWAAALKKQGVTRVVTLLESIETAVFTPPLDQQFKKLFKRFDIIPLPEQGATPVAALAKIVAAFDDAHKANEKVVVHCRAGVSRTGLALASWLVAKHGMTGEEAKAEIARAAKEHGVKRAVKVEVPTAEQLR